MIIFLTVICFFATGYFIYKHRELKKTINDYQSKVCKDYEVIVRYLLKLPTSEETEALINFLKRQEEEKNQALLRLESELDAAKNEIILMFQKERVELDQLKTARSKDTFKSLRTALASKGNEQQDDT